MALEHGCGQRHVLAFVACLGFFNLYTMRVSISIAIVAMVDRSNFTIISRDVNNSRMSGGQCAPRALEMQTHESEAKRGEFKWSRATQELILSSFNYGYVALQVPAGWLAERFGAKHLLGLSVIGCSFFSLLIPVAARQAVEILIGVIVAQGLLQGISFPCMHVMWSKWAPPLERGKLVTFTYAGGTIGTIFAMPTAGLLCDYGFDGGWPSVFYVFGGIGLLWGLLWHFLAFESPTSHPRISAKERQYIESTLPSKLSGQISFLKLPWGKFFTSPPFIAIVTVQFCHMWGFTTLLTNLPTYMKEVQGFDIKKNGVLTAVPYLVHWFFVILAGFAFDFLTKNRLLRIVNARKLANAVGLLSAAASLVAAGYAGCNQWAAVAILTAGVGLNGVTAAGYQSNHLDIAPQFAGTLMGIANSIGNSAGIVAPLLIAAVLQDKHDSNDWRTVFYIAAAMYVIGTVVYTFLAKDQVQKWAAGSHDANTLLTPEERPLLQHRRLSAY